MNRRDCLVAFAGVTSASLPDEESNRPARAKTQGGWFTRQRIRAARRNVARYPWAAKQRDQAVAAAARWRALSLEAIWKLVPGPALGRTMDVVMTRDHASGGFRRKACPACGQDRGFSADFWKLPYRCTCAHCGEVFPKNDFAAYLESGRGPDGFFTPARADRRLLFHPEHPDPADPLHTFGVDDGWGYRDADRFPHRFVPFALDQLWSEILTGARALGDAWVLTGDSEYARRGVVLLDRIADAYPAMAWEPFAALGWYHSDGDSGTGKVWGRISECVFLTGLARAYDQLAPGVHTDPLLWGFLTAQGERWSLPTPKGSPAAFCAGIEDRILRVGLEAVREGRIRGNHGIHETAAAWCAVALDSEPETSRWLDWIFSPGGAGIPYTLLARMDRDGFGEEGAPGYGWGWGRAFHQLAELLGGYRRYDRWNLDRDFPALRRSYTAPGRMALLNRWIPAVGDFGACMNRIGPPEEPELLFGAFRRTGDPEMAAALQRSGGAENPCRDVYEPEPERWPVRIAAAAQRATAARGGGRLLPGFGLLALELGEGETAAAAWLALGRNYGHGHADCLNLGLIAGEVDFLPDLGYPDFATRFYPKLREWTGNTISHNTVLVDGRRQERRWGGRTRLFQRLPGFRAAEVSGSVYPQARDYRRLTLMIGLPDGGTYLWDLFRVQGGIEHLQSWHGPEGALTVDGLSLASTGRPAGLGEADPYLESVRRGPGPAGSARLTWDVHPRWRPDGKPRSLCLHLLTPDLHEVILAENPRPSSRSAVERLGYCFLRRRAAGRELETIFSNVIEPYAGSPLLSRVRSLPLVGPGGRPAPDAAAIEVTLPGGVSDLLLVGFSPDAEVTAPDGTQLRGRVAHIRRRGGALVAATLVEGETLNLPEGLLAARREAFGTVSRLEHLSDGIVGFRTRLSLPTKSALAGELVRFETASDRDPAYVIQSVRQSGGETLVSLGPDTFDIGFRDPTHYAAGRERLVEPGAVFRVSGHAVLRRQEGEWRTESPFPAEFRPSGKQGIAAAKCPLREDARESEGN